MDWTPTSEQVEMGLNNVYYDVRAAWAKRMDFAPTQAQIEAGLNDTSSSVRDAWMERLKMDQENALLDEQELLRGAL